MFANSIYCYEDKSFMLTDYIETANLKVSGRRRRGGGGNMQANEQTNKRTNLGGYPGI